MIRGSAERVEDRDDNKRDAYDEKGIFGCILSGLLSPEPLEGIQHGNTFGRRTLDIQFKYTSGRVQKIQEIMYHRVNPDASAEANRETFGESRPDKGHFLFCNDLILSELVDSFA